MLLEKVKSPSDLIEFSEKDLYKLADEIRKRIIDTVSQNGGHLASNLGVVELTLAVHLAFNCPVDRIIWDVGHQTYTHKLITGRQDDFDTIRCFNGLSGFPKTEESKYDNFNTGHSSTSISAALGMACARDIKNENYSVVAIIGDASISSGMAFEALNHAGHTSKKIIVILNDNEMSINKNVGALSQYLSRFRVGESYLKLKVDIANLIKKMPVLGDRTVRLMEKLKDGIKYLLLPGMLFEELGFTYYGPLDGHNIKEMQKVFSMAKKVDRPVLIHIKTIKGKGYSFAEEYPHKFHGIGPFEIESGTNISSSDLISFSDIFSYGIIGLADKDSKIIAISAAMVEGTGLNAFFKKYPERSFDVGIAEQHAVTMAAGMAINGLKPVVAIYSTFLQRAYDQVLHDVCMQNLPVVFILDRSGIVGEDGPTHHGLYDISYLRHMPNIIVLSPSDGYELIIMLEFALLQNSPVAIRIPRKKISFDFNMEEKNLKEIELGVGKIIKNGTKAAIFSIGSMLESAILLERMIYNNFDFESTIIDARFAKPLDERQLKEICYKHDLIITIEENVLSCGYGSSISEFLHKNKLKNKLLNFGVSDIILPHGDRNSLLKIAGMSVEQIFEVVKNEFNQ